MLNRLPFPRWLTKHSLPRLSTGWGWVIFLAGLLTVYLLVYVLAPGLTAEWNVYIVTPLAWLVLAGQVWVLKRLGWVAWQSPTRRLLIIAVLIGTLQTAAFLMAGLFTSFGYSPYAHRLPALIGNLWYLAAGLAGMEAFRATLVHALTRRSPLLAAALGSLLPALLLIPAGRWSTLTAPATLLAFLGATLLPLLAEGLLAALLAWAGGPLPTILYRAIWLLFEWLSPILPNPNWLLTAFIGTLVPLIGFFYLQNELVPGETAAPTSEAKAATRHTTLNAWWWVLIIGVSLFWFNAGLFGVRPFVVSGYSMKPTFVAGDVVLIAPVDPADVKVGDIIQFRLRSSSVVHRVVAVENQGGRYIFHTRGDNNNVDDDPVPQEDLQGRVILVIPKVGWPALGVKVVLQWLF